MNKTLNKKFLLNALVCLLLFAGFTFGCASEPSYEVESYQDLQEEFKDYPDIFFADISVYDNASDVWCVVEFSGGGCSKRVLTGYRLNYPNSKMLEISDGVVFPSPTIKAHNNEYDQGIDEYKSNMIYRGIPMKDVSEDLTEIYNNPSWPQTTYPQGTYAYRVAYDFNLQGYRYSVSEQFILTPDELPKHDKEQVRQAVEQRVFILIDSILDQGGVAK